MATTADATLSQVRADPPRAAVEPVRLGRRPVLDGLRGLAVLAVIGIHLGLLDGGYIGVDMFFVLSGFLITALLYEEWDRTGTISLVRFYRRRLRRLVPALLVLLVGFAIVILALDPFDGLWPLWAQLASTLFGANNWVTALAPGHGHVLGALVPTWTLAQEIQFYVLWPLALWFLLRRRVRVAGMLALLSIAMLTLLASAAAMRHIYPQYNTYTSPLDRGAELLLGSAVAILWRGRLVPAVLRQPAVARGAAAGLLFLLVHASTPHRWWYLSAAGLSALLVVNLLGDDAGESPAPAAARRRLIGSPLRRILGSRPLCYAGRISYGVYLYHLPIYYLLWTYVPGRSPWFYAPIVLGVSFAAAGVSWKLIESPILRRTPRRRHVRLAGLRRRALAFRPL